MNRWITECIGTFFLVLTIGLVVAWDSPAAALAIGSVLMVMVYMGGHISGAHYNPAVTLAILLRGKVKVADVAPYMVAQVLGAVIAALASWWITGRTFVPAPGLAATTWTALGVEVLFTFALALVVLNVATIRATEGNSFFGLAIGFTVTAAALAGGPVSGGAFNPAVGIGPAIVHAVNKGEVGHVWLYVVGPFAGGALAAFVFRMQHAGTGEVEVPPITRRPEGIPIKTGTPASPTSRP